MDSSKDWRALVETKTKRTGELNALECMDYLCTMPAQQRLWWDSMIAQHAKANQNLNLMDLVNSHKYFFDAVKDMNSGVHLPVECPLENIQNLKTGYARLLFLLQKAINPQEQALYLKKLDFSMQGVICGAARKGPYMFISEHMNIIPTSGITDWNKFKKYAPKMLDYYSIREDKHGFGAISVNDGFSTPLYTKYKNSLAKFVNINPTFRTNVEDFCN